MKPSERNMPEPERREENRQGYPAEKARQGHIVLRSRSQRIIFIAGVVVVIVLALIARFWLPY
jgi:hypothetical protein